ncbi:hypothetical protein ASE70_11370 [Sphingomonas sp. Leaf22]|uniref:hypothetical protein n=1 Tax=Sphingomonas sp. Leaf22 TaxID=1735687 RepID=UPI0007022182|nr:hypothetical protein [Sphingomonas sp. Leaf22]KQM94390.1 hypothetical protein ASE70_11370 [Sphingomonas sp. Leaf22]
MKRALKGFAILVIVLAVLIGGGLWLLIWMAGGGSCETTYYQHARLSNGAIARVQMTDCGATTGFSRVVIVTKPGLWDRECHALALRGQPQLRLDPRSDGGLKITHNAPAADVIAQNSSCFGNPIQVVQER